MKIYRSLKRGIITAALFFCGASLSACGGSDNYEAEEDTVFVSSNGDIRAYIQSDFSEEYYDQQELLNFIDSSVEDYIRKAGEDTVKLEEFYVQDDIASARMSYASVTDYADFNGVEFFTGTVISAQARGYRFDGNYIAVEKGEPTGEKADGSEFMDSEDLKCVIIGQPTAVKVSGDIVYVSEGNVTLLDSRLARVSYDKLSADAEAGYIIYKK